MHVSASIQSTLLTSKELMEAFADDTDSEWPLNSHYYDPLTMRSSLLRDFNNRFIYEPGLLYFVQHIDDKTTHGSVPIETADSRQIFKSRVKQPNSRITILLLEHLFNYQHDASGGPSQIAFTLSVNPDIWIWLLEEFHIYPQFVEFLHEMLGRFSSSTTYHDDGQTPKVFHLMVKVPSAGHLEGAIYLQYEFSSEKIILVIAGNDLKSHLESLIEQLSETKGQVHPFSLVFEIISRYFRFLNLRRREIFHAVTRIERKTGRGAISQSDGIPEETNPENFDLPNMHWTRANTRNMTFAIKYQLLLCSFLQSELLVFVGLRVGHKVTFEDIPKRDKMLYQALTGQIAAANGALEECYSICERAQSQLTAADTIISTWIAKQSQRTANESKAIAMETRKDSTSMKTIAGLTMVYLPSTFMATVFGTDFFNFSGDGTLDVQPDIWKFVLISVVLTLVTALSWVWLNARGTPRWLRDLSSQLKRPLKRPPPDVETNNQTAFVQPEDMQQQKIAMNVFLNKTVV